MEDLKHCPICGGDIHFFLADGLYWRVKCTKCPLDFGRYWFTSLRDAVKAWNRRVKDETTNEKK